MMPSYEVKEKRERDIGPCANKDRVRRFMRHQRDLFIVKKTRVRYHSDVSYVEYETFNASEHRMPSGFTYERLMTLRGLQELVIERQSCGEVTASMLFFYVVTPSHIFDFDSLAAYLLARDEANKIDELTKEIGRNSKEINEKVGDKKGRL